MGRGHRPNPITGLPITPRERFDVNYVVVPDGCWIWTGVRTSRGYGIMYEWGRQILAHRFSYQEHVGPLADGMVIDHLCRREACVNWRHLEQVTQAVNVHRALPSTCKRGHHTLVTGQRCVPCRNEAARRRWAANPERAERYREQYRLRYARRRATMSPDELARDKADARERTARYRARKAAPAQDADEAQERLHVR